jgi:hypothetical protein
MRHHSMWTSCQRHVCLSSFGLSFRCLNRDREEHVKVFVPTLHEYLKLQDIEFQIFILDQSADTNFNRGLLVNAGVLMLEGSDFDHFCIHDADTLPHKGTSENKDNNITSQKSNIFFA